MIVRLKGVKKVRAKGKTYYYHRKTMTRLPNVPGTEEFLRALSSLTRVSTKTTLSPGTLGSLSRLYRSSPEFAALAPSSKRRYNHILDNLKPIEGMPLVQMTSDFLYAWRDKKAAERSRSFANLGVVLLRIVFTWGKKRGHCKVNPALDVDLIRKPRNAPVKNRPWRSSEVEVVMAEAPPWLRLATAIAAYTGLRQSDVARVTWACYDGQAFETRQQKTGAPIWVPVHYKLRELLDAAPRVHEQIVVGIYGRPVSQSHISAEFWKLVARLHAEGKVGAGLSFHGLRHTLGTALAEAGCDPPTIAAVLGQTTTKMAEHYSRTANRRGMAGDAIKKMEGAGRGSLETSPPADGV